MYKENKCPNGNQKIFNVIFQNNVLQVELHAWRVRDLMIEIVLNTLGVSVALNML